MTWIILILSLPAAKKTPRMRIWRALKQCGAATLRDGVYLLPSTPANEQAVHDQAQAVRGAGGNAHVLAYTACDEGQLAAFKGLFDRTDDYAAWLEQVRELAGGFAGMDEPEARRREGQLRRELASIEATDFFPGAPRTEAKQALTDLESRVNRHFSPDEPTGLPDERIEARRADDFLGRRWATRRSLWVDRVASAWLIRRFIDPGASFVWLAAPADCPPDAVGFDFDGATFTHVGELVTFEVLVRAFGLVQRPGIGKLCALVHYLDVGGVPVAEGPGLVAMLGSARRRCESDDAFLESAGVLLDHMHAAFAAEKAA